MEFIGFSESIEKFSLIFTGVVIGTVIESEFQIVSWFKQWCKKLWISFLNPSS